MSTRTPPASDLIDRSTQDMVRELADSGLSLAEIERETGIPRGTLSRWRRGIRAANEAQYRILASFWLGKSREKRKILK